MSRWASAWITRPSGWVRKKPRTPAKLAVCSPPIITPSRALAVANAIASAIRASASAMTRPVNGTLPRSDRDISARSRSSSGLYVSSTSDMYRTAAGPACAPLRKLSVRSKPAPNSAAATGGSSSGDDARKRESGGAKLGWRNFARLTIDQLKHCLHEARQGEGCPVHRRGIHAQLAAHRLQAQVGGGFVDAGWVELIRADHPAPQHPWIDRDIADIG